MGTVTTGSFDEIQDDLGGSNPISLSEYYRESSGGSGSTTVPNTANNAGVPKSGTISVADISSVDGGTGANDVAYSSNPYITISKNTNNFSEQELGASCAFNLSVGSQGYSTADGDGNKPGNTGVSWSGSGISFSSGSGTPVTATITASSSYSTTVTKTAYLSGNGTSTSVSLSATTRPPDLDPTLSVTTESSVDNNPSTSGVTSNGSTVGSLDSGQSVATSLNSTLSNAAYKINSGSWITGASTVSNGDVIYIKLDSGDDYDDSSTRTVTVGDYGDTYSFTVYNRSQDTTPDDLTMPADYTLTGAALSTSYQTGTYYVSGIDNDHNGNLTSSGTNGINISDTTPSNGETIVFSQTSSSSPRTTFTGTATMSNMTGMTDTTHSYTITTGDNGILGTGGGIEYSPSYGYYGNCTQWMCPWVAKYTITRTLKIVYQSSGTPYIALYLYDTISDTAGTQISATDGSQWVWHSTYYLGNSYSDIDAGDQFRVKWSDSTDIFPTSGESFVGGWASDAGHSGTGGSGSGTSRVWTSDILTLSDIPYSDGTTSNMASRTRTYQRGCECYSCFGNDDDNNEPYSVWMENVSGTTILGSAPGSGSTRCRLTATTTYSGMCF